MACSKRAGRGSVGGVWEVRYYNDFIVKGVHAI